MAATIAHPKVWACSTWLMSVGGGAAALVLADFGAPAWIFVLLGLWLCTVGLPTTVGVLLAALLWGRVPGLGTPPLGAFVACALALSLILQYGGVLLLERSLRGMQEGGA